MRNIYLLLVGLTFCLNSWAQSPQAVNYQAVLRDASGIILTNQSVGLQVRILSGSPTGSSVYTEEFATNTNAYGIVNIQIGTGTTTDDFSVIDWSAGPYFIETSVDAGGGTTFSLMGTSQIISVPYALYAETAETALNDNVDDADADPTNELNSSLGMNGNSLEITDAGGTLTTDLSSLIDDADADPTNELNTGVVLNGTTLESTDAGGTISTDLSSLVDDADADPTNEIELPSGGSDGQVLSISGGNVVWSDLPLPTNAVFSDGVARTITNTWTAGPTFNTVSGFKAGSKVKITYSIPSRNDDLTWGGLYIEPQVSFNNGATWNSLGSTGYDGNIMNNDASSIGTYTNVLLIDPTQSSDFSVKIRFYYKSYTGTTWINTQHDLTAVSGTAPLMSGVNGTQHYTKVIIEEVY